MNPGLGTFGPFPRLKESLSWGLLTLLTSDTILYNFFQFLHPSAATKRSFSPVPSSCVFLSECYVALPSLLTEHAEAQSLGSPTVNTLDVLTIKTVAESTVCTLPPPLTVLAVL